MADAKLSELTAATSAAASDTLYLVQSGASKKITVANFMSSVDTPAVFKDSLQLQGIQTLSTPGSINSSDNITVISNPDNSGSLTIATGDEGQIKIVVMSSNTGGQVMTLSGSNIQGSIVFSQAGDSATLIYIVSKWYMIGGTATIS